MDNLLIFGLVVWMVLNQQFLVLNRIDWSIDKLTPQTKIINKLGQVLMWFLGARPTLNRIIYPFPHPPLTLKNIIFISEYCQSHTLWQLTKNKKITPETTYKNTSLTLKQHFMTINKKYLINTWIPIYNIF